MKKYASLSVIGKDRPGIVAGISKVLFQKGCNILDSSMTLLASEFAMILLLELPRGLSIGSLEKSINSASHKLKLSYSLKPLKKQEIAKEKLKGKPFIVSVYGADKPGIVYRVSELLSKHGANITDVQTNMLEMSGRPVYIMIIEADMPVSTKMPDIKSSLEKLAATLQVNISINPAETIKL
jgi:glycine cleavage system transcriptional repressor